MHDVGLRLWRNDEGQVGFEVIVGGGLGRTPMIEVRNLDTGPCRLFLKLESQNPGGSIKDRIGLAMIETMAIYCLVIALLVLFANPFVK